MPEQDETLSERELEVLDLLIKGASNREIADKLVISPNTVKVHVRKIYTKLGVSSRTEATMIALQQGLVTLPNLPLPLLPIPPENDLVLEEEELSPLAPVPADVSPPAPINLVPMPESVAEPPVSPVGAITASSSPVPRWLWLGLPVTVGLAILLFLALWLPGWLASRQVTPVVPTPASTILPQAIGEDTHWLAGVDLPTPQVHLVVAAVGLDVYVIGGENDKGLAAQMYIYRPNAAAWESGPDKPTPVAAAAAAVLFGEIYVVGGQLADGTVTGRVEVYSPANGAWRSAAALPQAVMGGLALTDGSFLYFFGGWNGDTYRPESYVYDPGTDTWRPIPALSTARAFMAGGFLTGQLYVVGGYNGTNELATCARFEPGSQTWNECPSLLSPRGGAGAAVIINQLYVFGGGLSGEVTHGETFDPNSETWQVINMPDQPVRTQWVHFGLTSIESKAYLVGGRDGDNILSQTYIYERFPFRAFIPAAQTGE
ncbi:MAG: hypothetical protein KA314_02495 [Chloroflexi bacterium]|nr:hypothetical protein [Chloroflexota bacterium]MBP8054677.1 hypothetical protein [Chloroflexota bacterium]